MKRIASVVILWVYAIQLASGCVSPREEQESSSPGMQGRAVVYPAPVVASDTVLPTQLDSTGLASVDLSGRASVSRDGAAEYSLELWTPPGRAGVEPKLALTYNSNGGNGLLGMGWALSGLSRINRCKKNLVRDGVAQQILFDSSDRFCLDGQRLVAVAGTTGTNVAEYRTENDNYSRILVNGYTDTGPASFLVYTKTGLILTYGSSAASTLEQPLEGGGFGKHEWGLSKIQDLNGNYITVDYDESSWKDEHWPTAIHYTGHMLQGFMPTKSVYFQYEYRKDTRSSYVGGLAMVFTQRLKRIEVWDEPEGGPATRLRSYVLRYTYNGLPNNTGESLAGLSLLTELQECDGRDVCGRPTRFTYAPGFSDEDALGAYTTYADSTLPGAYSDLSQYQSFTSGDINGDGLDDLIYRKATNGMVGWYVRFGASTAFGPELPLSGLPVPDSASEMTSDGRFLDWNGDGLLDFAVSRKLSSSSTREFSFLLNQGNRVFGAGRIYQEPGTARRSFWMPDLDGDGRPDILHAHGWKRPDGVLYEPSYLLAPLERNGMAALSGVGMAADTTGFVVDMNGAGRMSVLLPNTYFDASNNLTTDDTYYALSLNANGSPSWLPTNLLREEVSNKRYLFMDANGDGLADRVSFSIDGGMPALALNSGRNSFVFQPLQIFLQDYWVSASTSTYTPEEGWGGSRHYIDNGVRVVDLNGDGRQDLLYMNGGKNGGAFAAMLSTGKGFKPYRMSIPSQPCSLDRGCFTSLVLDINGDGQADFLQRQANGTLQLHVRQGIRPFLLLSVTEGAGRKVEYQHSSVANSAAYGYTQPSCAYPQMCLHSGMWVVTELRVDAGDGHPMHRTSFRYENGRFDTRGLGWLGFASRRTRDEATGATLLETYDTSASADARGYPLLGQLRERSIEVPLGAGLIRKFVTTYTPTYQQRVGLDGVPYYSVYSAETVQSQYGPTAAASLGLLSQVRRTTEGFDPVYGNVTAIRETWNDGYTTRRDVTYQNQAGASWLIGLPTRISQTGTWNSQTRTQTQSLSYVAGSRLLSEVVVEPDSTDPDVRLMTHYTYSDEGLLEQVTVNDLTGQSRVTSYEYDEASRTFLTATINPLGHRHQIAVHPGMGLLAAEVDTNGVSSRWQYDGFGRLRTEDGPTQADVSIEYAGDGVRTTQAGGVTSKVFVDRLNRPVRRQSQDFAGNPIEEFLHYDDLGRLDEVDSPSPEQGRAITRFQYDALGRRTRLTHPDNTFKTYSYTGLTVTETDERGIQTSVEQNARGWTLTSTEPNPAGGLLTTRFEYAPFGLPTLVESVGIQTLTEYDVLGRRTRVVSPDSGENLSRYTAFGELRESRDAEGQTRQYQYDALGRVARVVTPHGDDTYSWDTAPHGVGALAGSLSADGVATAYTYDSLGRRIQELTQVQGSLYSLDSSFDSYGRLESLTYPSVPGFSRFQARYEYTPRGALRAVRNADSGLAYWQVDARSATGLLTQATFGNGVQSYFHYDGVGQLRGIETGNGSADIQRLFYEYDAAGNTLSRHDAVSKTTEEFEYDALQRLSRWTVFQNCRRSVTDYAYSADGNLVGRLATEGGGQSETYGYGGTHPHAMTQSPTGAYTYDARGFQVSAPGRTVEYNTYGLPRRISRGAGDESVFAYDAFLRRVNKQRANGESLLSIGGLYEKRWEGGQSRHTFSIMAAGAPVALVSWTPGAGGSMAERVLYLHGDRLGSVESLTDAQGNSASRLKFDPFGRRVFPQDLVSASSPLPREGVRHGFTGHSHDDELGLIDMGGRMYDSRVGRFLTPDPHVQAPVASQSHNRYAYVWNNPLRYTDPSGFMTMEATAECTFSEAGLVCNMGGSGGSSTVTDVTGNLTPGAGTPRDSDTWYGGGSSGGGRGGGGGGGMSGARSPDQVTAGELMEMSAEQRRAFMRQFAPGVPVPSNFGSDEMDEAQAQVSQQYYQGMSDLMSVVSMAGGNPLILSTTATVSKVGAKAASKPLIGTGAYQAGAKGGTGLGKIENMSIRVSEKGLGIVEQHLSRLDPSPINTAMIERLKNALSCNARITGGDASFYLHELHEATLMRGGMEYDVAHAAALSKYDVSPFSVYHPEVISKYSEYLNPKFRYFWGLP